MQNQENQDYNEPLRIQLENLEQNNPKGFKGKPNFPSPDNPPWNIWGAVGVWVASVLLIILLPYIFVQPYISGQALNPLDIEQLKNFLQTDPTAISLQLGSIIPAHFLTILIGWLVITRYRKYPFKEMLGWEWNGFKIWHGFAIFFGFYVVAVVMKAIFGEVENDFEAMLKNSRIAVYFVAFFATFTAPLVEEMVYRGLLYSAFQRKFGVTAAVALVTILFTAVHVPQYSLGGSPDYATIITILALSLTLTMTRVWTNNLLPCIILHTIINGIQSALLLAEPYLRQFVLEKQTQPAAFFLQ